MITKELLTISFSYWDVPTHDFLSGSAEKTIAISIFDTFDEAVSKGNEVLKILSDNFEIRAYDRLGIPDPIGLPTRMVSNYFYPTLGVRYRLKITPLSFDDLEATIAETFEAHKRYMEYRASQEDDND